MPFVGQNDDPKFVNGFECGQIWQQMKTNMPFENYLVHSVNKEQIELMCKRFHYSCFIEKIDDTWSSLTAKIKPEVN